MLNLGILAHVDAGKTSLTERILFDSGAISSLGSVDGGNTKTDSGELERERGITIRSAVASFQLGNLQVNIIDTPGHPDFIAEVERTLRVLDGVILVISAVEGVQAQTRILMKSLKKIKLPTLIFVNKIDRKGACGKSLLSDIEKKLSISTLPMSTVKNTGTPQVENIPNDFLEQEYHSSVIEKLSEHSDYLLKKFVNEESISKSAFEQEILKQTLSCKLHPLYFGSAIIGHGIGTLLNGVKDYLRPTVYTGSNKGDPVGSVFSISRDHGGEKIAYLRLFSGQIEKRQKLTFEQIEASGKLKNIEGKVNSLEVVESYDIHLNQSHSKKNDKIKSQSLVLTAGHIGKIKGFPELRVGAHLGKSVSNVQQQHFSPPTLETIIKPTDQNNFRRLHCALKNLSDEDPLIQARLAEDGSISTLLYGEVQKEVIGERLLREYGIETEFSESLPVYFERPAGTGYAIYKLNPKTDNDFWATIGLRIEPDKHGRGNTYIREAQLGRMPTGFYNLIEDTVYTTLEQGLYGWPVTDCSIFLTDVDQSHPTTVASDFRNLTPVVLMQALQQSGTNVFEPQHTFELEYPEIAQSRVLNYISSKGLEIYSTKKLTLDTCITEGAVVSRLIQEFNSALPGLTHGEGTFSTQPGLDRPIVGKNPVRQRRGADPLNYETYLRYLRITN